MDTILSVVLEYGPWSLGWIAAGWLAWRMVVIEAHNREDSKEMREVLADNTQALQKISIAMAVLGGRVR